MLVGDAYGNVTNAVDAAGNAWSYIYGANSVLLGETVATAGRENVLARHVDAFQRPTGYSLVVDGIGRGGVGFAYDTIGNRLLSSANVVTNTYQANNLNQYTRFNRTIEQSEQSNNLSYDTAVRNPSAGLLPGRSPTRGESER